MKEPNSRNEKGACADAPSNPEQRYGALLRFKHLTETALPVRAREEHWPIRLDHCFKRICLDHAFGDVWYRHLRKPAERHLAGEALDRAVQCAEDLLREGLTLLTERNLASLRYRGKLAQAGRSGAARTRVG